MTDKKTAIIIGVGPAGLTAADELLDKTDILPIIFEMTPDTVDEVMLLRGRLSRIFFLRKFFTYPVILSRETIANLDWCGSPGSA